MTRWPFSTEMNRTLDQAKTGSDFVELAKTYSEDPVNDTTFIKHGDLSRVLESAVFSARKGEIVGPLDRLLGLSPCEDPGREKGNPAISSVQARFSSILFRARTVLLRFRKQKTSYGGRGAVRTSERLARNSVMTLVRSDWMATLAGLARADGSSRLRTGGIRRRR